MADGIDAYLPDDSHTQGFLFVVFLLVVLPVVVVLSQVAPYVLTTAIVLAFLAWLLHHTGFLSAADAGASTDDADALASLRDRYARGEIGDDEFEHRLDQLVETESLDAADAADDANVARERER